MVISTLEYRFCSVKKMTDKTAQKKPYKFISTSLTVERYTPRMIGISEQMTSVVCSCESALMEEERKYMWKRKYLA